MKATPLILLFMPFALLLSCTKTEKKIKKHPPLLLLPMKEGKKLPDALLNAARLDYFISPGLRTQVPDFGRAKDREFQKGALASKDIVSLSAIQGLKTYYLSFGGGQEDTLVVEYKVLSESEAKKAACFCDKALVALHVNGLPLSVSDTSDAGVPIYSYERE